MGLFDAGVSLMAKRKSFCVVGSKVSEASILSCKSGTHFHVNWREVNLMHDEGEIEPLGVNPEIEKTENEPDYVFRWLIPGRVLQFKRHVPSRGISAKYGWLIAMALEKEEQWAKAWVATVRGELETEWRRASR